jgi:Pregnancy-associated plasma protein-A
MKSLICCLLVAMASLSARAQLEWRISVKLFTGPTNQPPRQPGWATNANINQSIANNVDWVNAILAANGRGYRWQLTEIVTVPGSTAPLPASTNSWFNLPVSGGTQDDLDAKAKSNPAGFQFRNNAINFYFSDATSGPNGGYCAFPTENQHVILVAPSSFLDVLIHESGHFFGLAHTFDSQAFLNADNSPCTNGCACAQLLGGNDGIADTPLDTTCWNQNQIALNTYGQAYALLNGAQQYFVDNTWSNIMSYHAPGNRFTSDQLDVMTDYSNGTRFNVASGRTVWVDRNSGCFFPTGERICGLFGFGGPFSQVADGVSAASVGDVVLIRSGNYNERITFTKRLMLSATRGWATIGSP